MRPARLLMIALPLLFVLPRPTQAQTIVTTFVGTTSDKDTFDGLRGVYGISGAYWPAVPIGAEVDFGFHRNFYPDSHPDADHHVVGNLSTLALNVIVGAPLGGRDGPGFRPYLSGGIVLFQIQADEPSSLFDVRGTDKGWDFGGGAIVLLGDHVGIRSDVRYLKDPREHVSARTNDRVHGEILAFDAFSFTRVSVGFVLRF